MSPYTLPEGNVAIAFSGGRTSAFMLHEILRVNGPLPERVVVSFQNTGREMPQTLDFVQECGERWGVRVVWLEWANAPPGDRFRVVSHNSASRDGEPFAELIDIRPILPNQRAKYCTKYLKLMPARDYLLSLGWAKGWKSAVGIRADEANRGESSHSEPWERWFPLIEAGITKADVSAFWDRQPFNLRLPNIKGKTPLGNCDGCFLKSEANLAALARDYPERHAWWERMEDKMRARIGDKDTARFEIDVSRRQLREFIERQGDWIFNTEGALCQADDGECV